MVYRVMKEFKKAHLALQYRSDIESLQSKLSTCSNETKERFFEKLESEPDASENILNNILDELIQTELNPYQSESVNQAYRQIRDLGSDALNEFDEIVNALSDSIVLSDVVEKLRQKYGVSSSILNVSPTVEDEPVELKNDLKNGDHVQADNVLTHTDGWVFDPVVPWRRYAARIFDITLNGTLLWMLIGVVAYQIAPYEADRFFNNVNPVLDVILTAFLACFATGVLTGFTGSTVGKWIFGVRIMNADGNFIGVKNGISRDLTVWMKGLAFGIPIASLVTLFMSFRELKKSETTAWDGNKYVILHRPSGALQYVLNFVGIVLFIVMTALVKILYSM